MADEIIKIDVREALGNVAELKSKLTDLRNEGPKVKASFDNAFGGDGAIKEAQAVDKLRKTYQEVKDSAATLRKALANAYDPRAIKTYSDALAKADVAQKKLESGAKAAGVSLKNIGKEGSLAANVVSEAFGAISKATVILAIIDGVYQLAKAGLELSNSYNKAQKQFEAFLGSTAKADETLNALTDFSFSKFLNTQDVLDAGKSLLAFGEASGNLVPVLGRIADISAATGKNFGELTVIYGKARAAGVLYAEDINQLVDAGIPIIGEFAKQMGVSADQVKKLASEGKIKFEELQLALFNLTAEGGKFSKQAEAQATTLPGLWTSLVNRVKPLVKDLGDTLSFYVKGFVYDIGRLLDLLGVADKAAEKSGSSLAQLKAARDAAGKANAIDNNVTTRAALEKANEELLSAERDFYEKRKEQDQDAQILVDAADKARNQKSVEQLKKDKAEHDKRLKEQEDYNKRLAELELQKLAPDSEALAIAKENLRFKDQEKEFKKFKLGTEEIETIHQANLFDIRQDFENKRNKQAQESAKRFADIYAKATKDDEEATKKRRDDLQKELEYQRDLGSARIDIQEEVGKGVIISLTKSGAKEKEIKEAQRQLDLSIQKARLENELEFQQNIRAAIADGDTKKLAEVQAVIDKIKAGIANINADTAANPDTKKKKQSLAESLGLSEDDIDNLNRIKDGIVSALQDISAARLEEADAAIEAANKKTELAQSAYDKEKDLADQGYANNLDDATRRLELAKKNEADAQKIKEDAQKKQLQLDSAIQFSSLLTASANIFKGYSTLPIAGQILAIAAVASMFAAFAAARSRAAKATKFRTGGSVDANGIVQGPSHENGGVGFEVEGGEFLHSDGRRLTIVNKKSARAENGLLAALNKGDDAGMNRWALDRVAKMNHANVGRAIGEGRGSSVSIINNPDKKAHGLLKQIRDKKAESATTWTENGYRYTRKGGRTERMKIAGR